MLDGKIARRYNQITTFGKFADPLADKMLTTSAFLVFMQNGIINAWALLIILVREFAVSGIRLAAVSEGKVIAASFFGKLKTVTQMIAIIATIIIINLPMIPYSTGAIISAALIWVSVVFTVLSGADYIMKNKSLLKLK
jgi:CDP-diacylglycerol--glycerol-3-phosphate 3-phosphatidyltransferase